MGNMAQTTSDALRASKTAILGRPALFLARLLWAGIALGSIGLFLLGLPARFETQIEFVSNAQFAATLQGSGISAQVLAYFAAARLLVFALVHAMVGAAIFLRRPSERAALFVSLALITFGTIVFIDLPQNLEQYGDWVQLLGQLIQVTGTISMGLFFYVFPDGTFAPRWTRYAAALWVAWHVQIALFPAVLPATAEWGLWIERALRSGFVLSWVLAQLIRYRNWSNDVQRQQTRWVVFGVTIALVGWATVTYLFRPASDIILVELRATIQLAFFLFIPLSIALAMFRHRLWDIDPILNRTLVYGMLTALVLGIYVLIVSYLEFVFRTGTNSFISLVATAVVAVLFQPLRERLQQGVNRLMYGDRDDPTAVLSRLGQRLEASLEPDFVLPAVVETVAQALKLPYVAIALKHEKDFVVAAEYGRPPQPGIAAPEDGAGLTNMPLTYQSEVVGQLIVAPRAQGERFSPADRNLLSMLSRQAGVAAHAIRLTHELRKLNRDLQQSREELVTLREEERRRLRRDLHDGVGPILASFLQRLDTVRLTIPRDPDGAAAMAEELKGQVRTTIAEVRRLAYGLRPPVLDELGLVSAIREYTLEFQGAHGLQVMVVAPGQLANLPAAVEVAAYRIVLESFSNTVRHASATSCRITLAMENQGGRRMFCVEVQDDGRGFSQGAPAGVGLVSMRERTAELGGEILIDSKPGRGTLVRACLPYGEEEE